MSGLVVGVRPEAALASAPAGLDREALVELIGAAEAGLVNGAMARAEQRREG